MPRNNMYMKLLMMAFVSTSSQAMVFYNRFFPLFEHPRLQLGGKPSIFWAHGMFSTAHNAVNDQQASIGIPELFGPYDQQQYADSFVLAGLPDPLRSDWQGPERIEWKMNGKIQMQGAAIGWEQRIIRYLSIGFTTLFMQVNSRIDWKMGTTNLFTGPGDNVQLDEMRRSMFSELGIRAGESKQTGFGDIDTYIRAGNSWEYCYRMKKIDLGFSLGLVIPTGLKHEINQPASVPFGGNGHWGLYGAVDGLFELRDDLKVGFLAQLSKQLPRTSCQRMPVNKEPSIFGVITGPARVSPGWTGVFAPYIVLENLRKGFGVSAQYLLVAHGEDDWHDERADKSVPTKLAPVQERSEWLSEYGVVNAFYDFGETKVFPHFDPILSIRWYIPAVLFAAKNMIKTQMVSFGIEFAY